MIKEHVHHFILRLYFFVLEAYYESEHGSFREKALEKTLSGARKTGRAVEAGKRKVESAKGRAEQFKEAVKEKVSISGHGHSDRHGLRSVEGGATFREQGRVGGGGGGGGSFRGEEEVFEERFSTIPGRERTERTAIREEAKVGGSLHGRTKEEEVFEERFSTIPGRGRTERTVIREEAKVGGPFRGRTREEEVFEERFSTIPGRERTGRTVIREEGKVGGGGSFHGRTKEEELFGERFSTTTIPDRERTERTVIREEAKVGGPFRGRTREEEVFEERFSTMPGRERTERTVIREEAKVGGGGSFRGHTKEGEVFGERTVIREEGKVGGGGSYRGRTKGEELFEERFSTVPGRDRTERTVIREERMTSGGPTRSFEEEGTERFATIASSRERGAEMAGRHHHNNRSASFREEQHFSRSAPPPPPPALEPSALRAQNASRSAAVAVTGSLVGGPPVSAGKTLEKVANWREHVAEEMVMSKEATLKTEREALLGTSKAELIEDPHGKTTNPTTTVKEISFDPTASPRHLHRSRHHHHQRRPHLSHHQGLVNREPSLASGQSYRSAGARTSLVVHPPSSDSLRERLAGMGARAGSEEWVEDPRLPGAGGKLGAGGRHLIGGGDVGVNGEVRRSSDGKGWK